MELNQHVDSLIGLSIEISQQANFLSIIKFKFLFKTSSVLLYSNIDGRTL